MKTKILVLVLCLLMLVSLVACNNNPETPTTEPGKTETPTTDPGKGETPTTDPNPNPGPNPGPETHDMSHVTTKTYGDQEFTMLCRPETKFSNALIILDLGNTPTSVDRAVYERMTTVEAQFGIKFDLEFAADYLNDLNSKVDNYTKSGTNQIELIAGHAQAVPWNLAMSGKLYEWGDVEILQPDRDYWSQNAKEQFSTPGGKLFIL